MVLTVSEIPLLQCACDSLVLPLIQNGPLEGNAAAVNEALDGLLEDMRARKEFKGEAYQVAVVPTLGRLPAARLALVGVGKREDCTLNTYRLAIAAAARALGKRGLPLAAADVADAPFSPDEAAIALAE